MDHPVRGQAEFSAAEEADLVRGRWGGGAGRAVFHPPPPRSPVTATTTVAGAALIRQDGKTRTSSGEDLRARCRRRHTRRAWRGWIVRRDARGGSAVHQQPEHDRPDQHDDEERGEWRHPRHVERRLHPASARLEAEPEDRARRDRRGRNRIRSRSHVRMSQRRGRHRSDGCMAAQRADRRGSAAQALAGGLRLPLFNCVQTRSAGPATPSKKTSATGRSRK